MCCCLYLGFLRCLPPLCRFHAARSVIFPYEHDATAEATSQTSPRPQVYVRLLYELRKNKVMSRRWTKHKSTKAKIKHLKRI